MAEEKKSDEEKEGQEGQEGAPKKGLPVKLIIIGVLAICLIGGGFFAWKSGLFSRLSGKKEVKTEAKAGVIEIGPIYEMEDFIVNLSGGTGNNYLKVKVSLELDSEIVNAEVVKRLAQLRDSILTLLSSKTYDEVKTPEGKYQIRAEIIANLNQYLKTGKITNVYFSDFIVQ